jgi:YD repeat-containing protein
MGNMVHASDNIREVRFTYGALGVLKSREQDRHWITFGYNSELQLRRIGNEAGDNYFFELDGLGQVVTETGFDGLRREYERDGAGRVTRVNRPGGKWTEYQYDGLDNILKEEQYDGEVSLYTYDKDGMLVKAKNSENLLEFTREGRRDWLPRKGRENTPSAVPMTAKATVLVSPAVWERTSVIPMTGKATCRPCRRAKAGRHHGCVTTRGWRCSAPSPVA